MDTDASIRFFETQFQRQVRQALPYLRGMFDPSSHCLFARDEMHKRFAGWEILRSEYQDYPAANDTTKSFVTVIARRPEAGAAALAAQLALAFTGSMP